MAKLLDLFCGAGGASMGYFQAGFETIVGIDIKFQPNYPFTFIQTDAVEFARAYGTNYDVIHASPPCQAHSHAGEAWKNRLGDKKIRHKDFLPETRQVLRASHRPYVIENTPGAPLENPIKLCGGAFGLNVRRHRLFEIYPQFPHKGPGCANHNKDYVICFGGGVRGRAHQIGRTSNGPIIRRPTLPLSVGQEAMGIGWMNRHELSQAIPPAYTKYLGEWFLKDVINA